MVEKTDTIRRPDTLAHRAAQTGIVRIFNDRAAHHKELFAQTRDYTHSERSEGYGIVANTVFASANKVDALLRLIAAKALLRINHIRYSQDISAVEEATEELQASKVAWGEVSPTKPTLGDVLVTFLLRAGDAHEKAEQLAPDNAKQSRTYDERYATYLRAASTLFTWGSGATAEEFIDEHEDFYGLNNQAADEIRTAMVGFHANDDMPEFIVPGYRKQPSSLRRRFDSIRASIRHRRENRQSTMTEREWQGGILGTEALRELIETTDFVSPKPEKIDAQSFDIHLGNKFTKVTGPIIFGQPLVDAQIEEITLQPGETLVLQPEEFLLGETAERFKFPPHLFGQIETNGGPARAGMVVEFDKHIDGGSGWDKRKEQSGESYEGMPITLQIKNHRTADSSIEDDGVIQIPVGYPVGRMEVLTTVGNVKPYTGHYNHVASHTVYQP